MSKRFFAKIKTAILIVILTMIGLVPLSTGAAAPGMQPEPEEGSMYNDPLYIEAIKRTAALAYDTQAQRLAAAHELNIVNVMWEDTGRYKGSSVGPNISDVTIQVMHQEPRSGAYQLSLMPVIRYPNFSDLSADIAPDDFYLMVGNERGLPLYRVSLREYLDHFRSYLHDPQSWRGESSSLLAERDTHVLVSAQAAFLPVPQQGLAEFNPVIFNYQSYAGDPAVLTIVATREGTSATIIDNARDGFPAGPTWGQRLFYNQNGERASFTGQRLSEFVPGGETRTGEAPQAADESGLNMVLVIQVPLKQKQPMRPLPMFAEGVILPAPTAKMASDVEEAVIGHGKVEGPFTEIDGLEIERDPNYPIRVTVQFYKATSNGIVSKADVQAIAEQIQRVYQDADYVGSLVVSGETGRPTEYEGPKEEPSGWWESFWQRYESNSGLTRQQAYELWLRLKMNAGRWFKR